MNARTIGLTVTKGESMKKLVFVWVFVLVMFGCTSDENFSGRDASVSGWHRNSPPSVMPAAVPTNLEWEDHR